MEEVDEQLMARRDAAEREVARRKERMVVTLFGVVRVNRRLYRDRATGEPRPGRG